MTLAIIHLIAALGVLAGVIANHRTGLQIQRASEGQAATIRHHARAIEQLDAWIAKSEKRLDTIESPERMASLAEEIQDRAVKAAGERVADARDWADARFSLVDEAVARLRKAVDDGRAAAKRLRGALADAADF